VTDPLFFFWGGGGQRIPEASSCKYLEIIICSDLRWAYQVNYTVQKAWKGLHFVMFGLTRGNSNTKCSLHVTNASDS
jgi:hypothetical protein